MWRAALAILWLAPVAVAGAATLTIPSADGVLTIDGVVDENIWSRAAVLPGQSSAFPPPFPAGGEMRAMVRGGYLCLSARIPETGRLVARSTGRDPVWWKEDLVTWTVAVKAFATTLTLSVNPLGAYRVDQTRTPDRGRAVLAAAAISTQGWSVEAAIPVDNIADVGFISVERVRAPRPDAPELRWVWPGVNERLAFRLAPAASSPAPPQVVAKDWRAVVEAATPAAPSDPLAEALASVPPRVLPDGEQMWELHLRSRVMQAAVSERKEWEKVATVAGWEKFRRSRLAALKTSLGPFPERTPLRASVTRQLDYGKGFRVENLIFESRPGLVVAANLYLPAKISGRLPAIVVVHSHHAPKVHPELQDLGMTWARSGTAVLIMDQLGAGERIQSQPWPRESYYSRLALGMQLYLAGDSLMKWIVWDLRRGIDLLLERPYIDPGRIVMLGAVAGGGDPAAVAAALDERIAAVVPFNFGEAGPEEHYLRGPRPYDLDTANPGWGEWESTRCLRRSIVDQFFPWFICASVAPRRFVYSMELAWPNGVEKEPIWGRYKKVFEWYGKRGRLDQLDGYGPFPGPGEVTDVGVYHRRQMDPIFQRWLAIVAPAQEFHNPRPDADLMCLTPQAARERRPKTASEIAAGIARSRLLAAREQRALLSPALRLRSLFTELKDKLGDIEPNTAATMRAHWTRQFSGFTAEAFALETSPAIEVPVLLIKPDGAVQRYPVVLALAGGGKVAFLSSRRAELAWLLRHGVAVCLADVRGTGETRHGDSTSLAATELMLGGTALGVRLKDARTVLHYLAARSDLDGGRVALWGESFAEPNPPDLLFDQSLRQQSGPQAIRQSDPLGCLLALLTALYEGSVRAVAARGGLVSYLSVLQDRFCYMPQEMVVPGVLETADIPDMVAALAPHPVLLEGAVDGRNRLLAAAEITGEVREVSRGSALSWLLVRQRAGEPGIAAWLAGQLSR